VFHGKRGELRQRYRQGQEDQLSALGSSTSSCCGTRSTWTRRCNRSAVRGSRSGTTMWPVCLRSGTSTSTCSAATPSHCPTRSRGESCDPLRNPNLVLEDA